MRERGRAVAAIVRYTTKKTSETQIIFLDLFISSQYTPLDALHKLQSTSQFAYFGSHAGIVAWFVC